MANNSFVKPWTSTQVQHINAGKVQQDWFIEQVQAGLGKSNNKHEALRHTWIVSPPGLGKTHEVKRQLEKYKVYHMQVEGSNSLSDFVTRLAYYAYNANGRELVVWIDDCDDLFGTSEGMNVMKIAMAENNPAIIWNKQMGATIAAYRKNGNEELAEALEAFQSEGGTGIRIPAENIRFIVTTNISLCASRDAGSNKKKINEGAVRSRCNYVHFDIEYETIWGWFVNIMMNAKLINRKASKDDKEEERYMNLDENQKRILLDWMFINWKNLADPSMRMAGALAAEMLNYPETYPDYWERRLMGKRRVA